MDYTINALRPLPSPSKTETVPIDVIEGHRPCQTKNANWMCIRNIYEKLHRPNFYDIGGTYIDSVPDFWFNCKIEKSVGLFFIHLFAGNHLEGEHSVGVSTDSLVFNSKENIVRMMGDIETVHLDCKPMIHSYISTITFKNSDVEDILQGKTLYIGVQLSNIDKKKDQWLTAKMQHDNAALLLDPVGSDFIITSEDGEEFPVHRCQLSLHSEVFKAMLQEDMAESRTGRVKLVDVSSEDLKMLLEYIYTSTINKIEKVNIPNLIMLADRYNLLGMRQLLDHILIEQLAPDTALDILVLADRFSCSNVKCKALQYIKSNRELFKNVPYDQVDSITLMKELCAAIISFAK